LVPRSETTTDTSILAYVQSSLSEKTARMTRSRTGTKPSAVEVLPSIAVAVK